MKLKRRIISLLIGVSAAVVASMPTNSIAALGDGLVATGGTITATFEGASAADTSNLQILATDGIHTVSFFQTFTTAVGTTFTLGSLAAGTPFDIMLVDSTTGETWHVGQGTNNADGIVHANVISNFNGTGRTFVGFEDTRGGGDKDYNDMTFSLAGAGPIVAAVPEPATSAMLIAGLALVGFLARRKDPNAA